MDDDFKKTTQVLLLLRNKITNTIYFSCHIFIISPNGVYSMNTTSLNICEKMNDSNDSIV
jgi:hypothetical protein